jgi:peptidyl-prolyl cis-trans isomerase C
MNLNLSTIRHQTAALALLGSLAWLLTSCRQAPDPKVLATVGDKKITIEDLRNEVQLRRNARRPVPDKESLLQDMITQEALLRRARQSGIADDPRVQHEIRNLLIGKLHERELTPRLEAVQVNDVDLQKEYDQNLVKYTKPAKARLALLYLETNSKMGEARRTELRERLAEAQRKAKQPASPGARGSVAEGFGALAIDYSDDQSSRYRGGDIGWLDAGNFSYRWPRLVLETGYALEEGQVSELIETDQGLYLVMKTGWREGSIAKLEAVRPTLEQGLLLKKRREIQETFRREIVGHAAPKINRDVLGSVELPAQTIARNREVGPPELPLGNQSLHGN